MNFLIIIILAIIQGITEFLPVSSSGHLVLFYKIFNISENRILLSIILHLATLFSVIIFYRKSLIKLIKKPFCHTNIMLLSSTIITCFFALIFKDKIKSSFNGKFLSFGFIITAIVLIISQLINNKNKSHNNYDITNLSINLKQSLLIGLAQAVACFPAISRSGSTIACALILNCDKAEATEYSFLLSIPIIFASTLMEIISITNNPETFVFNFSVFELLAGFIVAFIFGLLAIKFMTKLVKNQKLYYFSFYLLVISIISLFV